MYDHITDQGVAYGSCWGNIHHYGYSMRGLYVAYFLMKEVLNEAGKLNEAERTLRWYAITNEVYPKPVSYTHLRTVRYIYGRMPTVWYSIQPEPDRRKKDRRSFELSI